MKRAIVILAALAAASDLHAQGASADAAAAPAATVPAGWAARFDKPNADPAAAKFVTMGKGLHFTTGPSATWYRSGEPVDGLYSVQATFSQRKAPAHPESYGLMVFGRQMDTPTQNYVYFMVRGDGKWALKHRANDTDVHTIQDWTAHPAIVVQDSAGRATNTVKVDVAADSVRFMVNGQTLQAMPRSYLKDVSGLPGIRMNHGLDVHVADFAVTKK
jgi:hypothetical protein